MRLALGLLALGLGALALGLWGGLGPATGIAEAMGGVLTLFAMLLAGASWRRRPRA